MSMSMSNWVVGITREAARHAEPFTKGRARQAVLAPYATPAEVLAALRDRAVDGATRNAIVVALVSEARQGSGEPWRSMLLAAYAPRIGRLRGHLAAFERDDFESEAVLAFLEEVARVQLGPYTARALQMTLSRRLSVWAGRERLGGGDVPFDEDEHTCAAMQGGALQQLAIEVAAQCERDREPDLAEALLSAPTLGAYVARAWPDAGPLERRRHHRRLTAARYRVIRKLQRRLVSPEALAA